MLGSKHYSSTLFQEDPMRWYQSVFLGGLGGTCPTLAKLGGTYSADPGTPPPELGIYISLAIFAVLGGIIALAYGRENLRSAIAAGIAAPAIVTNVLAGFQEANNTAATDATGSAFLEILVAPAHAQVLENPGIRTETTFGSIAPQDTIITINPRIDGGTPALDAVQFYWTQDGQPLTATGSSTGVIAPTGRQVLTVPDGATDLVIGGTSVPLAEIEQGGYALDVTIQTAPTIAGDLIWGLGGTRRFVVEDVQVAPVQ
jgi:hypothetical protein